MFDIFKAKHQCCAGINSKEDVRVIQLDSYLVQYPRVRTLTNGAGNEAERGGIKIQIPDTVCTSSFIYEAAFCL